MIRVKEELHYSSGSKLPARVRQELLDGLIESNEVQLAAAAWKMHETNGQGMLVLRLEEISAPVSSEQSDHLVNVPYVTEENAPNQADEVCLLMKNYDPFVEIMLVVAFPEGALSFFVIETDPSPPAASAAVLHLN